jgi:hypothetical protein
MKKKLYALSGVFLIALVFTGLWASKAGGFTEQDPVDPLAARKLNGVSMEDMARGSELIVIGRCTGTQSQWIDNGRRLVTLATVEVTDTMKGVVSGPLTVVMPGGHAPKGKFQLAMTYAGAPTMATNEDVALFLVNANDEVANSYSVVGFNAGKLSIVQDVDNKQIVTNVPMKVRAPRATGLTSGNSQAIELSEFKALIEGYLK